MRWRHREAEHEADAQLKRSLPEPEQDVLLAGLMRRLWERRPPDGHSFGSLTDMCDQWADSFELDLDTDRRGLDPGLAREGATTLRGRRTRLIAACCCARICTPGTCSPPSASRGS